MEPISEHPLLVPHFLQNLAQRAGSGRSRWWRPQSEEIAVSPTNQPGGVHPLHTAHVLRQGPELVHRPAVFCDFNAFALRHPRQILAQILPDVADSHPGRTRLGSHFCLRTATGCHNVHSVAQIGLDHGACRSRGDLTILPGSTILLACPALVPPSGSRGASVPASDPLRDYDQN